MNEFQTPNFEFIHYNPKNSEHQKAKCFLVTNPEIRYYLSDSVEQNLNKQNPNAYLVKRENKIIGYLALYDFEYYLEMHYAIINSYRGRKYSQTETTGTSMIKETTEKIFKLYPNIEYIKLNIELDNIKSQKIATNAGYYPYEIDDLNTQEYKRYR